MRVEAVESRVVLEGQRVVLRGQGLVPGARATAQLHGQMHRAGEAPAPVDARTLAVVVSAERVELIPPPSLFEGGHSTFRGEVALTLRPSAEGQEMSAHADGLVFDAVAPNDAVLSQGRRGELARAFMSQWGMDAVRDDGEGLLVTRVDDKSRADATGLQVGDRLVTVGGLHVLRLEDLAPGPEGGWSAEVRRGEGTRVLKGPAVVPIAFRVAGTWVRDACFYLGLFALAVGLAWRGGARKLPRMCSRGLPQLALSAGLCMAAPWCDARITWALMILSWCTWSVSALIQTSWGPLRLLRPLAAYVCAAALLYGRGGISLAELTWSLGVAPTWLALGGGAFGVLATAFAGRARPHADLARAWMLAALVVPFGLPGLLVLVSVTAALALAPLFRAKLKLSWPRVSRSSVSA